MKSARFVLVLGLLFGCGDATEPARTARQHPLAPETSVLYADGTGRFVVGILAPVGDRKRALQLVPEKTRSRLIRESRRVPSDDDVYPDDFEIEEEEVPEEFADGAYDYDLWETDDRLGQRIRAQARPFVKRHGIDVVVRDVAPEHASRVPILVGEAVEGYESLEGYGGIVCSASEVGKALEMLLRTPRLVERRDRDPLAVEERRTDGDVFFVRFARRPDWVELRNADGHVHAQGRPDGALVSLALPDDNPYACVVRARAGDREREWTLAELAGTVELHVETTRRAPLGGVLALRALATRTHDGSPVAGLVERFALVQDERTLAQVTARSDRYGVFDVRLAVPEAARAGPARLKAAEGELAVVLQHELRVSVVPDRPLYRPTDTVHLRALVHRFPSGRPAHGEQVVFRLDRRRRKAIIDEFGIAATSFRLHGRRPGALGVIATAGGAKSKNRIHVRAFERPAFTVTATPARVPRGVPTPVTVRVRYLTGAPVAGARTQDGLVADENGEFTVTVKDKWTTDVIGPAGRVAHVTVCTVGAADSPGRPRPLGDLVAGLPAEFAIDGRMQVSIDGGAWQTADRSFTAVPKGAKLALRTRAGGEFVYDVFVPAHDAAVLAVSRRITRIGERLDLHLAAPEDETVLVDVLRESTLVRSFAVHGAKAHLELTPDLAGVLTLYARPRTGGHGTKTQVLVQRRESLRVTATPDREEYRPGDTAHVAVEVRDAEGRPRPAALGYWAVDEALHAIAPTPYRGDEKTFDVTAADRSAPALIRKGQARMQRSWRRSTALKAAAAKRFQAALEGRTKHLRETLLRAWRRMPLHEVRLFAGWRDQFSWLLETGRLDAAEFAGLRFTERNGNLYWSYRGASVRWRARSFAAALPEPVVELLETADPDAVFGPFSNAAIGLGGGAGGGRKGRGGSRNLYAGGGSGRTTPPVHARVDAEPTLCFVPRLLTDSRGRARLDFDLPGNLTTWGVRIVATDRAGGVDVTKAHLRANLPLAVDPWTPRHMTVGDSVTMPVAVRSTLPDARKVVVSLESSPHLEVEGERRREITVPAGGTAACSFTLVARRHGDASVTVGTKGDAARKSIRIHRDARAVRRSAGGSVARAADWSRSLPPDEGDLRLDVFPGALSEVVAGFDGMIRQPHGCFEQTSSTLYPMILALRYLEATGQSRPELEARAREFIKKGVEKLRGYEVEGVPGGFSLFGRAPASPFLTAYGLREFVDLQLEPELTKRVARYLKAWKKKRASYVQRAYVAGSLARAGQADAAELRWLVDSLPAKDAYATALAARTLQFAGDPGAARVVTRLAAMEWSAGGRTLVGARGRSADVETVALAVQALLADGRFADRARHGLERLAEWRRPNGSFGSTQATVQAIRALLMAQTAGAGGGDIAVRGQRHEFGPNDDVRRIDLGSGRVAGLRLSGKGLRATLTHTRWQAWTGTAGGKGPLKLLVTYPKTLTVAGKAAVTVRVENRGKSAAEQVTVEVGLPPGCEPRLHGIDAAHAERGERHVVLYLQRDLAPGQARTFRIPVRAGYRFAAKTAPSRAYEYYTPDEAAVVAPILLTAR